MAFSLTRPPTPFREGNISTQDHADDYLSSPLHAALSSLVPGSSVHPDHHDMIKEKEKVGIDVVVDSDCLSLKGTGVDVEPALLKGYIVLHLKEPTSIREITLQFRGEARLPSPSLDSLPLGASSQWYTLCNHEWSFLEGEKRHSHTLKAGIHQFPFQLQLGGSLPSSISNAYGGAQVSYKLRAVAVRPGLAHNLQAALPITVVRTFAPEALEYQQSLEIENTWPEKLMYSIMIPHKAWAAGDKLTAIVKFSPIAKGVRVLSVATSINESTKLFGKNGIQEYTRSVVTANHEIANGDVISVAERQDGSRGTPSLPTSRLSHEDRSPSCGSFHISHDLSLRQVPSRASSSSSSSHESYSVPPPPLFFSDPPMSSAESEASASTLIAQEAHLMSQDDLVTQLSVFIPKSITPSHGIEPIVVTHRIRWSILMSNLDGHTSELRCSLPLHILDARLLDEARVNSAATRRLLLGGPEAPVEEEQDAELPSYSAHVRDRVANMYLPESVTTRVPNPWVHSNVSPTLNRPTLSLSLSVSGPGSPGTMSPSPLMPPPVASHLPHVPPSGTSTPLDWVDSELLLSLSNTMASPPRTYRSLHAHSPSESVVQSRPGSRPESRLMSRRNSRAPSPERHHAVPLALSNLPETFVHDGHASRTLPGVFSIQMKPQTFASGGWLPSRSHSHTNMASVASLAEVGMGMGRTPRHRASIQSLYTPRPSASPGHGHASHHSVSVNAERVSPDRMLWHRAFTEVPDYDVASRGFIGGVTPLTSMRGLPSYEEAARGGVDEEEGDEDQVTIRRVSGAARLARVDL